MGVELGAYLRTARKKKNITISKMAQATHISPSYITYIEKGEREPSTYILTKISNYLEEPLDNLISKQEADLQYKAEGIKKIKLYRICSLSKHQKHESCLIYSLVSEGWKVEKSQFDYGITATKEESNGSLLRWKLFLIVNESDDKSAENHIFKYLSVIFSDKRKFNKWTIVFTDKGLYDIAQFELHDIYHINIALTIMWLDTISGKIEEYELTR